MDKRTVLALVLIGVVFLLWPVYMKKVVGVKDAPPQQSALPQEQISDTLQSQPFREPAVTRSQPQRTLDRQVTRKRKSTVTEKDPVYVTIQNDLFRGVLSSAGGGTIVGWQLKEYFNKEKEWVELIPDSAHHNLSLVSDYEEYDLSNAVYDVQYDTLGESKTYGFVYQISPLKSVEKTFTVHPGSYVVDMEIRFLSMGRDDLGDSYFVDWSTGLMPTEPNIKDDQYYYQAYALQGEELLKTKKKKESNNGSTRWMAVRTKYFVMALITEGTHAKSAELEGRDIDAYYYRGKSEKWKSFSTRIEMPFQGSEVFTQQFRLYLGPIDLAELKKVDVGLEKMMNFGMVIIKPFSIAFYHALKFLNDKIVHNYGWAIIIFAIFIKIILYPLTRKSFQSMKAMQELQPKITALKEKHKDDPQKLNKATMEMYKKEGVNPMGGCLPMILQMPVLFALFNLFRTTIMLRQATFLGIMDLSAPDHLIPLGGDTFINILPIIMGVTMIIQQKLSATTNPNQKAMAFFMPAFLTFIFYKLSAGLNLYYFMFNILTIAQELLIKRKKKEE